MFSGSCTQSQDRQPNHPISSRLSLTQGLAEQIHQIHLKCLGEKNPAIKKVTLDKS